AAFTKARRGRPRQLSPHALERCPPARWLAGDLLDRRDAGLGFAPPARCAAQHQGAARHIVGAGAAVRAAPVGHAAQGGPGESTPPVVDRHSGRPYDTLDALDSSSAGAAASAPAYDSTGPLRGVPSNPWRIAP